MEKMINSEIKIITQINNIIYYVDKGTNGLNERQNKAIKYVV